MSQPSHPGDGHRSAAEGTVGCGTSTQAELDESRARAIRREMLVMQALQSRLLGPVWRCFADPEKVLELGMGFWSSRVVLTAVELGLFTELARGPRSAQGLIEHFGWHPRASQAFLDALAGLGLLHRDAAGVYSNSRQAALFLDRSQPGYVGGLLELSSRRLYALWSGLGDLLQTGRPQAEEEQEGNEFFSTLYRDPEALRNFLEGMTGISTGEAIMIAARFPWKRFRTFVDIGAAQGALAVRVALTHPHLTGAGFDLPAVQPIFEEYVASFGLGDRVRFLPGDMNAGPLPSADVISFGHVLHGYSEAKRRTLIAKSYAALPPGGALLVYDAMIDPTCRKNYIGLLSSLNIMLETQEGFEATIDQCAAWLAEAGFVRVTKRRLAGPTSMVFGYKPPAQRR
jgi:precorrin-6B methylase 2